LVCSICLTWEIHLNRPKHWHLTFYIFHIDLFSIKANFALQLFFFCWCEHIIEKWGVWYVHHVRMCVCLFWYKFHGSLHIAVWIIQIYFNFLSSHFPSLFVLLFRCASLLHPRLRCIPFYVYKRIIYLCYTNNDTARWLLWKTRHIKGGARHSIVLRNSLVFIN